MGFLLDILVFALIAAFVLYRLYSVLGTRSGTEKKRPNPFASSNEASSSQGDPSDNVVDITSRKQKNSGFFKQKAEIIDVDYETKEIGVQKGQKILSTIKKIEPTFSVPSFLKGAKAAFEIILQSYAKGDKKSLKPLLAEDVFSAFTQGIEARLKQKETLIIKIQSLTAEITDVVFDEKTKGAEITVQFESDQLHTIERSNPTDKEAPLKNQEVLALTDVWTFARTLQSSNPNWVLVKTASTIDIASDAKK